MDRTGIDGAVEAIVERAKEDPLYRAQMREARAYLLRMDVELPLLKAMMQRVAQELGE